jgi:hypothetical protein
MECAGGQESSSSLWFVPQLDSGSESAAGRSAARRRSSGGHSTLIGEELCILNRVRRDGFGRNDDGYWNYRFTSTSFGDRVIHATLFGFCRYWGHVHQ